MILNFTKLALMLCSVIYIKAQSCDKNRCSITLFFQTLNHDWYHKSECPPNLYSPHYEFNTGIIEGFAFYCNYCLNQMNNSCLCFLCDYANNCDAMICNNVRYLYDTTTTTITTNTSKSIATPNKEINENTTKNQTNTLTNEARVIIIAVSTLLALFILIIIIISITVVLCLYFCCVKRLRNKNSPSLNSEQHSINQNYDIETSTSRNSTDEDYSQNESNQMNNCTNEPISDTSLEYRIYENKNNNHIYETVSKITAYSVVDTLYSRTITPEVTYQRRLDSALSARSAITPSGAVAYVQVPNCNERSTIMESFEEYVTLSKDTLSPRGSFHEASLHCEPYCDPEDNPSKLYDQMSLKKFREINPQTLNVQEVIGMGEFGSVHKAIWSSPVGEIEIAVKILYTENEKDEKEKSEIRTMFLQEAAILGQFKHPNILKLVGLVTISSPNQILTELMKEELRRFLLHMQDNYANTENNETIVKLKPYFLLFNIQIANGLVYLAQKGCIHRDIAARNILLTKQMVCKISDFGMSRRLRGDYYTVTSNNKIPIKWTAPEALFYQKYSLKSDVWSYGMLLYEIWSVGRKPWPELENRVVMAKLNRFENLAPPAGCPRGIYELMVATWHPDPSLRYKMVDVVQWLNCHSESEILAIPTLEEILKLSNGLIINKDALIIGKDPCFARNLYLDLQNYYII